MGNFIDLINGRGCCCWGPTISDHVTPDSFPQHCPLPWKSPYPHLTLWTSSTWGHPGPHPHTGTIAKSLEVGSQILPRGIPSSTPTAPG